MITFQIDDTQYYINHDKRIEEVWLFGSYARGEQDCYSDIDLLIIVQDCSDMEYTELKQQLSAELHIPLDWISLYQMNKITEMGNKGAYFLWHLKLEGHKLYSRNLFLQNILKSLPEYSGVLQDLMDYSVICNDIRENISDEYLDVTYELSVLASVIRNTAIAVDFLFGEKIFGRITCVETSNRLLEGIFYIPVKEYMKLYSNRLYITGKSSSCEKMTIYDIGIWLERAEKFISCAKEVYHARKNDNNMGRIGTDE